MKVRELIDFLEQQDPESPVFIADASDELSLHVRTLDKNDIRADGVTICGNGICSQLGRLTTVVHESERKDALHSNAVVIGI